jgi:hypothetical protein
MVVFFKEGYELERRLCEHVIDSIEIISKRFGKLSLKIAMHRTNIMRGTGILHMFTST